MIYYKLNYLKDLASKYKSRKLFRYENGSEYMFAYRCNLLNIIFGHIPLKRWSYESVMSIIPDVTSRQDFIERYPGAHNYARKKGLLDEIYTSSRFNLVRYDYESCEIASLKCKTKLEFITKFNGEYAYAMKKGFLNELCGHMGTHLLNDKIVKCHALECESKKEFLEKYPSSYAYASRNKIVDSICKHMLVKGNRYKRTIYEIHFPRINKCYVGLTFDLEIRRHAHETNSSNKFVKGLMKEGEKFIWLVHDKWYDISKIGLIEKSIVEKRVKEGWIMLNIAKPGSIGTVIRLTEEKIRKCALKCKTRSEFKNTYPSMYVYCQRKGVIDDVCSHTVSPYNWNWTYDKIKEYVVLCDSPKEFRNKYHKAYRAAYRMGIHKEMCEIIIKTVIS